jgi:hypothetical protein
VIQAVALPGPGTYLVSFDYRPRPALGGLWISALAGAGLVVWTGAEVVGAARRRRERSRDGPSSAVLSPD